MLLLRSGLHAALLSAYFGEQEYRELCQLAKLAATRRNPAGEQVFVLPGIMGSRLASGRGKSHRLLWLHPTAVGNGALMDLALPGPRPLRANAVMLPGYLKLRLSLQVAGFQPVFYPFDWRMDLEQLARAFVSTVQKTSARGALVVAHSMGGLLARAALRFDSRGCIRRLVQLGAPNGGSFAPLQALRAVYPTVRKIACLDRVHSAEELARAVYRTLPGLYQMLPSQLGPTEPDFFEPCSWPQDELAPDAAMLARARQIQARLPPADERCAVIAGVDQETVTSATRLGAGFEYELCYRGDGTVPLERAHWPGAATWFVAENHGALTRNDTVLAAVVDILRAGNTDRLRRRAPPARLDARRVAEDQLRSTARAKVDWETLSLDSRRRILDPVISPEFAEAGC